MEGGIIEQHSRFWMPSFSLSTQQQIHSSNAGRILYPAPLGLIGFKLSRGGLLEKGTYKRGGLNKFLESFQ